MMSSGNRPLEDGPQASAWIRDHLAGVGSPPFSFQCDGRPSRDLLPGWRVTAGETPRHGGADGRDGAVSRRLSYFHPDVGLEVSCRAVEYPDRGIVEWTLSFRNRGAGIGPVLSEIRALDVTLAPGAQASVRLHHHTGSPCTAYDYEPHVTPLPPGADIALATSGGRSSNRTLPYFNLELPGGGLIAAIGWPGQWAAGFTRGASGDLRMSAGMEETHFRLLPGEEVRQPRIVLQFWRGDRAAAHNAFRRWMLECNLLPGARPAGPLLTPCSSHQFGEMVQADEASQRLFIDRHLALGLTPDYWWMDAGWYPCRGAWTNTGTWEVDPARFPRGLRAVSDHAHARGVRTILWFEPERVAPGTWLAEHRPEWLLGPAGGNRLLTLGDPRARRWLTDHVSGLLDAQGIDLYRHDFNMDPLALWRAHDAPDRRGITEIGHVTGLLAYFDGLRRRRPGLLIDNCASGGRRNDVDTLRRAVPLLRSDHIFEPTAQQCHTYGLSFWVPYHGTGTRDVDPYHFRSTMCSGVIPCWDVRRPDLDYGLLRRLIGEWREIAPCFAGDYHPLTPYARTEDAWVAWQFDLPDAGRGVVQAFRRPESPESRLRLRLRGLAPQARYAVRDLDAGTEEVRTGAQWEEEGLEIVRDARPAAAVFVYRRLAGG